jgi:prolyl-tRNA editing enzyme YbaK/EbsC (Cys-tRNA(Pro) deacylase)
VSGPGSQVRETLDALGHPFELMDCDPSLADTDVFCDHYGVDPWDSANTILVASKSGPEQRFAACVLLSTTKLDVNKVVRKRLGVRRISLASAEQTEALTGMIIGGVTPIALPPSLPIWVDQRVMQREAIVLGGGDRHTKLKLAPSLFSRLEQAEIVEGLAIER